MESNCRNYSATLLPIIVYLRFSHQYLNIDKSPFSILFWKKKNPICNVYPINVHTSCFQFFIVVNNATLNTLTQVSLSTRANFSGKYSLKWNCWIMRYEYLKTLLDRVKSLSEPAELIYTTSRRPSELLFYPNTWY